MRDNLYEILNCENFCDIEEIKKKYKILVKINHPDKGGNSENFEKIKKAYDILKNKDNKDEYDNKLKCK
jgi:curved DNA-binding protein CbpA